MSEMVKIKNVGRLNISYGNSNSVAICLNKFILRLINVARIDVQNHLHSCIQLTLTFFYVLWNKREINE